MTKHIVKMIAILLAISMVVLPVLAAEKENISTLVSETGAGLSAMGGKTGKLLSLGEEFPAGTSVCDWVAMALALSGSKEDYTAYLKDLQRYVEDAYAKEGGLERVKSTTYHRIALVTMALGGNPRQMGEKPNGTTIDLIADGTYEFAGSSIGNQGLNGWIYALLTLDASGASVPQNAKFTREDMIQAIVSAQETDGGFGLAPGSSDVDISAMALQALAPYADQYSETVEAGLRYLAGVMNENCRYSAYGAESVESSAQVILALCALGIDPEEDARFCRGDRNVLTALADFRQTDGTYAHGLEDEKGDYLATAQTLLALVAVEKLRAGEGWIFDFADYPAPVQKKPLTVYYLGFAAATVAMICVVRKGKRRNNGKSNG